MKMNEIRRKVLEATKQELNEKPFVDGRRRTIIGNMFTIFEDCTSDEIEEGMIQLGEDLDEFGLILTSFPGHPEFLCAEETNGGEANG